METDVNILVKLSKYLISHGYPEESIVFWWSIRDKYMCDIAIIDPDSKEAIAIFELKRSRNKESENLWIYQLKQLSALSENKNLQLYLVFGSQNKDWFEIFYLTQDNWSPKLELVPTPNFQSIKGSSIWKRINNVLLEKNAIIDYFKYSCWMLGWILFSIIIIDVFYKPVINNERFLMLLTIVVLIILPVTKKLSILWLEFERLNK